MTGSKRIKAPFFGLALALGLGASPAWAQGVQTEDIPPPPGAQSAEPSAEPSTEAPGASSPDQGPQVLTPSPVGEGPLRLVPRTTLRPPDPAAGARTGIVAGELGAVDANAIGLINGMSGGYGVDMWHGTPRATVARALPQMPVSTDSPVMHDIMRRILLTTAPLPRPADGSAPPAADVLEHRVAMLARMGATADVLRLLEIVPPEARTPALRRAKVDALFVEGKTELACAETRAAIAEQINAYWQKALATCNLLAGNIDQASLTLDLLREGGHDDPAFFAGAEQLMGLRVLSLNSLLDPTPVHIALLAAGDKPLPEDVLTAGPAILRALALNAGVGAELRARATELALAVGVVEPALLAERYRTGFEFTEEERAQPLTTATAELGLKARALLFVAAEGEDRPAAKAELINRAFELAEATKAEGAVRATSRLYASALTAMPKAGEFAWFAGRAARALWRADRYAEATAWVELARSHSFASSDASRAANTLWPLARIAERQWSQPWPADGLADWRDAQADVPTEVLDLRETVLLNLLDAFGEPLSGEEWQGLMGADPLRTARVPSAAIWHAIAVGADQQRLGETLMLSMIALSKDGPARAAAVTLQHVVTALLKVGLEKEARALALEAALAAGA